MSHWRPDRLSLPGAGVPGTGASALSELSAWSGSCVANPAVPATPSTFEFERSLSAKDDDDDDATATPILL